MARLSDVPVVLRAVGFVPFVRRIVREILDDNLFTLAAGLAYSWLFAIFPFLVFLLNLFPYLAGGRLAETRDGVQTFLKAALPDPAADMLWTHMSARIEKVVETPNPWVMIASLAVALWAASGGIAVTMAAMEKCYELEKGRAFYKRRPMAFGLTVMVSALVVVLVMLLPAGAAFKSWLIQNNSERASFWGLWAFDTVRAVMAVAVVLLILAVLYHFGPGVRHRWQFVTPGAVFVLGTWVLVGLGFRYYVNHFGKTKYEETYGSVGGAAILLLLFYIDALVLLIGSQINSEIDFEVLKVPRGTRNFRVAERRLDQPAPAGASHEGSGRPVANADADAVADTDADAGVGVGEPAGVGAEPGARDVAASHGAD
jgi:membrane protein